MGLELKRNAFARLSKPLTSPVSLWQFDPVPAKEPVIVGAVLAGGKGSRLGGINKGLIELRAGVSIADRLLAEIRKAGILDTVVCSDRRAEYARFRLPVIPDRFRDAGPIAGIEAALRHFRGKGDGILFLPCDMPRISKKEIRQLMTAFHNRRAPVVTAVTGRTAWHSLFSVVRADLHAEILRAIRDGRFKLAALWQDLGAETVSFADEHAFANINTPYDLEKFRRQQGRGAGACPSPAVRSLPPCEKRPGKISSHAR